MTKYTLGSVLRDTLKKHKSISFGLVALIIISSLFALLPPLILGKIVDRLTNRQVISLLLVLSYFILTVLSSLSESFKEVLITVFGQKMTHGLRSAMSKKLARLPASYLVETSSGELSSRFVNDVDAVDDLFSSGVFSMMADLTSIISMMVVIFMKSIGLGILLLIALPLLFGLTRAFQKRMLKAQVDNRDAIGKENAHIPDTIRNRRTIHVFHAEGFMAKKYARYIDDSFNAMERSNFYDASYSPIIITSSAIIIALMMSLAGAGKSFQSFFGMSVGSAVTLIAYVNQIFSPLESIGMEIQSIQSAAAGIKRIAAFMNEKEKEVYSKQQFRKQKQAIKVSHLDFGYGNHQVLHDFSMAISQGEHVRLTGRTGCGKSTLLKLILGLYKPQAGAVRIDDVDAVAIDDAQRRKIFGYVAQDFVPVSGTLRDQLALQDPRVDDAAISQALQIAGIEELIGELPEGLNTKYDASLFSKGQWQLFSVARAIVLDPKILLLDEVTANLDAKTEQQLTDALNKASKGRTVISVTHRLYHNDTRLIEMN